MGHDGTELRPTFFVADEEDWSLPNFLGMATFLDNIRFAVDSADQTFYFAAP